MPKLVAKVEGRGNGIKTRVVNCGEIASSLHRKPAVLIKFFGCELGAQSRWDEKEEAAIVNGAFEASQLQDKLCNSFLPKFVLCPNCGLPETDMKVKKEMVKFECAACGYAGNADMSHKLITFILADDKKSKDAKKKEKKKDKKAEGGDDDGEKSATKEKSDKGEKKEKKKDKEKTKEKKKDKEKKKKKEESDEEEWFTDVSLEAVEARRIAEMSAMSHGGASLVEGDEAAKAPAEDADKDDSADKSSGEDDVAEGVEGLDLDDSLLDSLLEKIGDSKKSKEVLPKVESWAEELSSDASKGSLFAVIEKLPENITKHATIVLKALYDKDLVADDDIFAWFDVADQDNAAVAAAKPFVDFLRE